MTLFRDREPTRSLAYSEEELSSFPMEIENREGWGGETEDGRGRAGGGRKGSPMLGELSTYLGVEWNEEVIRDWV